MSRSGNSGCGRWKAKKVSADIGTVVVIEDDPHIADLLDLYLRQQGFRVLLAGDGEKGLQVFAREDPWIVILDVGLPGARDGFEVCREIRARSSVPVLFLTARDDEVDRILGLELGADDYLVKPFSFAELVARITALQRRPALTVDPVLTSGDLVFDPATRTVTRRGEPLTLTAIETGLIELLLRRSPAVVSRRTIAVQVWDDEADAVGSNTIDVHMGRLRAKLGDAAAGIETVRGTGYRLVAE
jgi:two-component system, OmpR family, response regulator